jgi:hypothetical protein
MKTQVEELVNQFEELLDQQDYESAVALVTETPEVLESDDKTKKLADRFARALILERFIQQSSSDETADIGLFPSKAGKRGEVFEVETSSDGVISFYPWLVESISFTIFVRLEVFENGNEFLAALSAYWAGHESATFSAENIRQASAANPTFLVSTRKWCLANIEEDLAEYSDFENLNGAEGPFYAGGASYSFFNLNVVSQEQIASPCSICGESLVICKSNPCGRNYFLSITGIDCSVDVVACANENEELDEFESILISVSELGEEYMGLTAWRIPTIEGTLNLHANSQDGKVRFLLGDFRLEDWGAGAPIEGGEFDEFHSEFSEITHPWLVEDEYLVVSWRTADEASDSTCFLWGLYRGEARTVIEQALK